MYIFPDRLSMLLACLLLPLLQMLSALMTSLQSVLTSLQGPLPTILILVQTQTIINTEKGTYLLIHIHVYIPMISVFESTRLWYWPWSDTNSIMLLDLTYYSTLIHFPLDTLLPYIKFGILAFRTHSPPMPNFNMDRRKSKPLEPVLSNAQATSEFVEIAQVKILKYEWKYLI